jgi:NTE family protein
MRVGLVLGAGGVVGHAWHAGVLAAVADATGWDPRDADVVVGTSAGSVVGSLLRGGVPASDLYGWRGRGVRDAPEAAAADGPRATFSPALLARAAASARPSLLAAMLPRGRMPTDGIGEQVRGVLGRRWPDRVLWVNAVRLADGARVTFGRDGAPVVEPATAVEASCAIPGFFAPVRHDGTEYVDGGIHSPTNADLLRGATVDLVLVSSPMSIDRGAARRPSPTQALRLLHRASLQREVAALRRAGRRRVVTLQPGVDDLALMGGTADAMDPRRREAVARQARETTLRRLGAGVLADLA